MTTMLGLDATGDGCSVALLHGGHCELLVDDSPRGHARNILGMVDELLAKAGISTAELQVIAFARGPGSFTGIRIAASIVQGLAFAADLPVIPISSLVATAQAAHREHQVQRCVVALDARMGEVYWANCELAQGQLMALVGDEQLSVPSTVTPLSVEATCGVGGAWAVYTEVLSSGFEVEPQEFYPLVKARADDLIKLAEPAYQAGLAVSPDQALPVYLRDATAWKASSR